MCPIDMFSREDYSLFWYTNTKSLMKPRIDTFPLFIVCAEYTRCIGIFSNIVSSLYYNDVSFLHGYRAGIIVLCIFEVKNYFNRRHLSIVITRRLRVLPTCPEWLRLSPGLPSPAEAGLWQLTQGSRYGNHHARSLETSWWIGNKNCQILRRTHSKLCYM